MCHYLLLVHLFLLKLFSIDLLIFSDCAQNDCSFDDLEYTQSLMLFITVIIITLLTNQAVFDNISLVKIEARCMLALFLCFYCLPPPPRF